MLSTFLLILYLSELIDMLNANGCQEVYLNEQTQNVMILLYSNNMVMYSDTAGRPNTIDVVCVRNCQWLLI